MRRIPLSSVQPGFELTAPIKITSPQKGVQYRLRIPGGTTLTEKHIKRLEKLGVPYITVRDPDTEDLDGFVFDEELEEAQEEVVREFVKITEDSKEPGLTAEKVTRLKNSVQDLIERLKDSQVMASFTSLKSHDDYTARHSLDVAKTSLLMVLENQEHYRHLLQKESGASRQYIQRNMLEDLGMGAMLHDIGKQEISRKILNKPDVLNSEEREKIETYPEQGYEQLQELTVELNAPVKVPAHQHHEQYGGTGYPRGLSGKDIHLYGRITACADVYSALTSDRPYRKGHPPDKALKIMDSMQEEGPHFDPDLFMRFKQVVFPYPIGLEVELSDGSRGVVCDVDRHSPDRPTVRVLFRGGERLSEPEEIVVNREDTPSIEK